MDNQTLQVVDTIIRAEGLEPTIELRKYILSRNMELFGKFFFQHMLTKPNNDFHKWAYAKTREILDEPAWSKGSKLSVAAPRGYAKSTLLSFVLPLWVVCYERRDFILLISETQRQAEDFLDDIKNELQSNELLAEYFPHVCGKGEVRWRQDDVVLRSGSRIYAIGCGGKARGRKHRGKRPDLILLDDVESRESVESETTRDKLWHQWFNKEVAKAGHTDGSTDFIVIGTILHEDSLLSKLLDRDLSPEWERVRFKAVISFADRMDLWDMWREIFMTHEDENKAVEAAYEFYKANEEDMLQGVKVLWPEGESYYDLMVMCLTPDGMSAFQSEKQNEPIDVTRMIVTKDELQTFTLESKPGKPQVKLLRLSEQDELHHSELVRLDDLVFYGAWDPSKGKKSRHGDFSAIVTIGQDRHGIIYVVDFDLKRRDVDQRMKDIFRLHAKYNYRLFVVETAAFQYFVKDSLLKRARALDSDLKYKLREDTGQTDKKLRIQGLVPYVHDGSLRFRHHTDWNQEYREGINQLVGFDAGAKHDDAPDALAMAFELVKHGIFRRKALIDGRTVVVGR